MRLNGNPTHPWVSILLYIGSMFLLFEWIIPLEIVTDTGYVYVFYLFVAYCYLMTAVAMPAWVRSPLKLLGLLVVMDILFFDARFLSGAWMQQFLGDLRINFEMLSNRSWMEFTAQFRTFLFLILLWMLSYLLYYWFAIVKRPLSFIVFTFVYLTVLDTFTEYSAVWSIIRTFAIGVGVLGISHLFKLAEAEKLKIQSFRILMKWLTPLLVVIIVGTSIGYAAPKFSPQWPDPVPFLQGTAEEGFSGVGFQDKVQRIGYGENDEQLGGGFIADDTTVFYASAESSQYWKVETKDQYTGKGWKRTIEGDFATGSPGETLALETYPTTVTREPGQSSIQLVEPGNLNKLPYRYGTASFRNLQVEYNPVTGEVNSPDELPAEPYNLYVEQPKFPLEQMQAVSPAMHTVPEPYLQLPETLPDRVYELTEEIIAGKENRYDQVKAVEQYFSRNGYVYETKDVPVPDDDQDFVDQFLFETQRGYCDHYSTSMVAMLRSAGIPARWVKGFTGGEMTQQTDLANDKDLTTYEVQNNNAHSWVEVFFPDVGWVPFEPTVGFSNQTEFMAEEAPEDLEETDEPTEQEEQELPEPELDEGPEAPQPEEESDAESVETASDFSGYTLLKWGIVIGLAVLIIWLISRYRFRLMSYWKKNKLQRNHDQESFTDAYQFLLKLLEKEGYVVESGQTLREFSKKVDRLIGNTDMSELTNYYERAVYREENLESDREEINRLWSQIVRNLLTK
ncbi:MULTISPECIES: DUF3488 and DUF4129 domain-containing transglutaminase family protein [Allobacillus]|uniref:Peptidase n=1 Tax=Allobacillus salarius TaxID=1955272 RepID=A0A556PGQ8_9BACI|nr:transglutaminase domain-containing protein [Allobacillus salarius]TSJ63579.1 peptidase [Allobacillus salarius]